MNGPVVQDDLGKKLNVIVVEVQVAVLVEELVLGEAAIKELELVELVELTVIEAAAGVLPTADVVVEVHVVEEFRGEALDVVRVHKDPIEIESDVDVGWEGALVGLTTSVVL